MVFGHKKTPSNWIVQLLGVTSHRRVFFKDIENYKKKVDEQRMEALDELSAQAQALDMGY